MFKKSAPEQSEKTKKFIEKAIKVHGLKYDYSKVKYIYASQKVIITCKLHGDFEQTPANHLRGRGYPKCSKHTAESFIAKSKLKHGDRYGYEKVKYLNLKEKVIITCKLHGDFEQTPASHFRGCGCKFCGYLS